MHALKQPGPKRNTGNASGGESRSGSYRRIPGTGSPLKGGASPISKGGASVMGGASPIANLKKPSDHGALTPRSECFHFSRKMIDDMQSPAPTSPSIVDSKPTTFHKGILKVQGYSLDCELVRRNCGVIDVHGDGSDIVPVYLHILRMTLIVNSGGTAPYRPILVRPPPGSPIGLSNRSGSSALVEALLAENWTMTKVGTGAGVSMRFSGRTPCSEDRSVLEPVQPAVDANAESTSSAYIWAELFEQIQSQRERYEQAALTYAQRTADDRKRAREAEQARKEELEEQTRPEKLWKAVKEGKAKTVAEILKRTYKHTRPAVPLMQLTDESSWSLLHWAAFKEFKELCQVLIKSNADVLAKDAAGNTPLHVACFNGSKEAALMLIEAMSKLPNKPSPCLANKFGSTAVMEAASNGHTELAASLLKLKVDWIPTHEVAMTFTRTKSGHSQHSQRSQKGSRTAASRHGN